MAMPTMAKSEEASSVPIKVKEVVAVVEQEQAIVEEEEEVTPTIMIQAASLDSVYLACAMMTSMG